MGRKARGKEKGRLDIYDIAIDIIIDDISDIVSHRIVSYRMMMMISIVRPLI